MRKLAVLSFQTLDGVMQAPAMPDEDRSGGFENGGWGAPFWEDVMAQVIQEAMAEPYDILLGRKTYEGFAAHWPHESEENPVARILNKARKYVATTSLTTLAWQNSEMLTGDVPGAVALLKQQKGPLIQVHGSPNLIQTLLAHDLIDEFRLWTFPVLVGKGKRLFEDVRAPSQLKLIKSGSTPSGVMMHIYTKAPA